MSNIITRFNAHVTTGTLNGVSAASVTGETLFMGGNFQKIDDLAAHVIVTADTSSLTVTPAWQVSNDNADFATVQPDTLNSAILPIATGAENVTLAIPAPKAARGYRYSRLLLTVGGATGGAADLYSIGYSYRQNFALSE